MGGEEDEIEGFEWEVEFEYDEGSGQISRLVDENVVLA